MAQLGTRDLAEVALEAGYFDQPHFTREFREFTGQSPAQFLGEPHAISDFFTQNVRNVQESLAVNGRY
jgi:AraC-like DNA-binding protein